MKIHVRRCARIDRSFTRLAWFGVAACALLWVAPGVSDATDIPQIVRVEEDWELVLETPDPNSTAPQVTCAISPLGAINQVHATFELNHQSQPEFVPGGMQLQVWNDETPLVSRKFPQSNVLALADESVRWTQTLTLHDGLLTFEIINGTSQTWGTFGGQGYLTATVSTNLTNLNGYTPLVSVNNSGIGFASNRVQMLVLRAVRIVTSTGEVFEDTTLRMPFMLH